MKNKNEIADEKAKHFAIGVVLLTVGLILFIIGWNNLDTLHGISVLLLGLLVGFCFGKGTVNILEVLCWGRWD